MRTYGVAVIGCGTMALEYLPMLKQLPQIRVVAVVDRKPERAKKYAEKFDVPIHEADYKPVLKRDDVDIVVITTRPSSHAEIAVDAMRAGKHVFSEKPMASTLEGALEMIRTAREAGVKMHIGFILRSNKTFQRLAEMVRSDAIGKPIVMRLLGAEHAVEEETWQWDLRLLKDTSPLIDCGSHYVDVMRWVTGSEAVSVSGAGTITEDGVPDNNYNYAAVTVRFRDDSVGLYEVGWGHTMREFWEKEFIGPKGRLRFTYAPDRREHREEGDLIEFYTYPANRYEMINVKCPWLEFDSEFLKLVKLIEEDADPIPGLVDALRSLEIVLAGHQAILTGRTMTIELSKVDQDT